MKAKKKSGAKALVATTGTQSAKGGRFARRNAYYKGQFMRTTQNKTKRARRHVRAHPDDAQAQRYIENKLNVASAAALGLCCKGRKRGARAR